MRCLILLLLVGSAIAQPEWYPIWNSHYTIRDHEICVRGDTVDVLYSSVPTTDYDTLLTYISYNVAMTQLGNLYAFAESSNDYYSDFIDMTAVSPQQWACLLHMNTRGNSSYYGQFFFQTELLSGNSRDINTVEVESSSYTNFPDFQGGGWSEGHSLTFHDDRLSVAYIATSVTPFDVAYLVQYQEFNSLIEPLYDITTSIYAFYNDFHNRAIAVAIPSDSVLVFSDIGFSGDQSMYLGPINGFNNQDNYTHPSCNDSRLLRELNVTASNRIVATFIDNSLHQIIPTGDGGADCNLFAQLATNRFQSWAFHPSYGFAALQVIPGYLLLARIDTSGNEVQPVGVLYETDGTSFIVDADVTISDSGKVIAVWSEYSDWNEGPHVLKIAWTDWTTFLDTPEQQAPAIPSEISLSTYPNPFNSTVTIKYDLPQAEHVSLSIFDIRGRLVQTLRDDFTPSGSHTQAWSPTKFASGVYFARLNVDHVSATSKLLYLK